MRSEEWELVFGRKLQKKRLSFRSQRRPRDREERGKEEEGLGDH